MQEMRKKQQIHPLMWFHFLCIPPFPLNMAHSPLRHTSLSHNSFQKSWEDRLEVTAAFMCADRAIITKKRGFSTSESHTNLNVLSSQDSFRLE